MIVGNRSVFAIESRISQAYERPSFLAIGYFVLHISGVRYGVNESDATLLACSFEAVKERIEARGTHIARSLDNLSAGSIADSFRVAVYGACAPELHTRETFQKVYELFSKHNQFVWAPDGDCAFDDGSYVLQFDVGDKVRLIAFRCDLSGLHDPGTLSELWIESQVFYDTLQTWVYDFQREWTRLPKL